MRLLWKYVDRCTSSWITKGQESRTHWEYCAKIISVYWIWKCQYSAYELVRIDHSINIGLSERAREDRQVDLMFLQCAWISLNSDCVTFDVLTFLFIFALKISYIYIPSQFHISCLTHSIESGVGFRVKGEPGFRATTVAAASDQIHPDWTNFQS